MDQSNQQTEQNQQEEENTNTRKTFIEELLQHVEFFCKTAMASVPELEGIAIVPVWSNQPEKIPPGFVQLRNAEPPYLASLLKLQQRMVAFSVDVNKDMMKQLRMFDEYAVHLSEQIESQLAELKSAEQVEENQESDEKTPE